MLRVVHLAITPLAGSPIRICRALREHAGIDARLITRDARPYGPRTFPMDLVWDRDRDEARRLLDATDLLVLHNQVGPEHEHFPEMYLSEYHRAGKPMVRQLHSPPNFLARTGPWRSMQELLENRGGLPQLVIAQAHERMYPNAWPVPNVVPVNDPAYVPAAEPPADGLIRIVFSPTTPAAANEDRWSTKGRDETLEVLRKVSERYPGRVEIDLIENAPLEEALERKRRAAIVIDEVITGNVHLSSLESLSMGVPTVAHVDARLRKFLCEFAGCPDLPWVEARLDTLETALIELIESPARRRAIGEASRRWMLRHWNDRWAASVHAGRYRALLEGKWPSGPRLSLDRFEVWWDAVGRANVERRRRGSHLTVEELDWIDRLTRGAAIALESTGNAADGAVIVGDLARLVCERLGERGRALTVVQPDNRPLPTIPPGRHVILLDCLAHREPMLARQFISGAARRASASVTLIERRDLATPLGFTLDDQGGWWNHDWSDLAPWLLEIVSEDPFVGRFNSRPGTTR